MALPNDEYPPMNAATTAPRAVTAAFLDRRARLGSVQAINAVLGLIMAEPRGAGEIFKDFDDH